MSPRIGRISDRTARTFDRIAGISGKTDVMYAKISGICNRTYGTFKRTGAISSAMKLTSGGIAVSSCRMSAPGPVPHNSNRIGRGFGRTDRSCEAIAAISGRIGAMFSTTGANCGKIEEIAAKIGMTSELIAPSAPVGADNLRPALNGRREGSSG